jgi:hypothetical protein
MIPGEGPQQAACWSQLHHVMTPSDWSIPQDAGGDVLLKTPTTTWFCLQPVLQEWNSFGRSVGIAFSTRYPGTQIEVFSSRVFQMLFEEHRRAPKQNTRNAGAAQQARELPRWSNSWSKLAKEPSPAARQLEGGKRSSWCHGGAYQL